MERPQAIAGYLTRTSTTKNARATYFKRESNKRSLGNAVCLPSGTSPGLCRTTKRPILIAGHLTATSTGLEAMATILQTRLWRHSPGTVAFFRATGDLPIRIVTLWRAGRPSSSGHHHRSLYRQDWRPWVMFPTRSPRQRLIFPNRLGQDTRTRLFPKHISPDGTMESKPPLSAQLVDLKQQRCDCPCQPRGHL